MTSLATNTKHMDSLVQQALDSLPVAFRIVNGDCTLLFESPVLKNLIATKNGIKCCESLGLLHREGECPTLAALQTGKSQTVSRWLGKRYVRIDSIPLHNEVGDICAVTEWFHDETIVKKLEAALVEKQDILETINKAMIEANHHLEDMQQDIRQKNSALENANSQLRSLDKLKDEFVSIVSHELKIPLTSIRGAVDLLTEELPGDSPERTRELLSMCRRNVERLHKLVLDLLDLARIESGHLSMSFERFEVTQWLSDAADAIRPQVEAKKLTLDIARCENLAIHGDRERLLQVVVNLLNNAIKFTECGRVSVSVEVAADNVIFRVSDTGRGIAEQDLATIFDKFSQSGGVRQRKQGFGLGLTIARGIVREHGGTIAAANNQSGGAVFTVTLPQPIPGGAHGVRTVN